MLGGMYMTENLFLDFPSFDLKDWDLPCNWFILLSSCYWKKGFMLDHLGKAWNQINPPVGIFVEKLTQVLCIEDQMLMTKAFQVYL